MYVCMTGVSISTDMISGFCGETDAEHCDTVSLMKIVAYQQAFMFAYSQREKTYAHRHLAYVQQIATFSVSFD
jgi:tRNA A37 methylthiotransferase MiaB